MLKKIAIVCCSLFFICSAPAFAALAKSSGPYVEGSLGADTHAANLAGSANVGYKINDYFAIEGGGTMYDDGYFLDLAVKGIFPFSNGFNIFGKFGGAEAHGHGDFEPVVYFGAGVGYSFTPNLSLALQWNTTTANNGVEAPNLIFVGLNYSF
jgi:hypothetical protein